MFALSVEWDLIVCCWVENQPVMSTFRFRCNIFCTVLHLERWGSSVHLAMFSKPCMSEISKVTIPTGTDKMWMDACSTINLLNQCTVRVLSWPFGTFLLDLGHCSVELNKNYHADWCPQFGIRLGLRNHYQSPDTLNKGLVNHTPSTHLII